MKSITFQLDDTGKVLVFPTDLSGNELPEDQKFNHAELIKIQDCLYNIEIYPQFYGITAKEFKPKKVVTEIFSDLKKEPILTLKSEIEPAETVKPVDNSFQMHRKSII